MTDEDFACDLLWREVFNQPLPMLGGGVAVRQILTNAGVSASQMAEALVIARART